MTEDKVEELLFGITGKLSSIETKIDSMSESILRHEARITTIEQQLRHRPSSGGADDFKTEMLRLLGKCLLIGLTSIASLTGAAGLIQRIIG